MTTSAPVYLDYNATTPVAPEVLEAMLPYLREIYGNPSSSHAYGRAAHDGVERARQEVADLLGVREAQDFIEAAGLLGAAQGMDDDGGAQQRLQQLIGIAERGQTGGHDATDFARHGFTRQSP